MTRFAAAMRICLVYDCLFPYTVGGAERWYRNLAERLAADGPRGHLPDAAPVGPRRARRDVAGRARRRASARAMALYARTAPADRCRRCVFGLGVLRHLLRHGRALRRRAHRVVPVLLAARRRRSRGRCGRYRLVVDWHEVWTRDYWREYLGARRRARSAARVQRAVRARAASARSASRGCTPRGCARRACAARSTVLDGRVRGLARARRRRAPAEPLVVFAGRHIPEKRAPAVVAGGRARARERVPGLRGEIFGDGPERGAVLARDRATSGSTASSRRPASSTPSAVDAALRRALCLVLPSRREGYGLVVVEAAARGTPSVVVAGAGQRGDRAGRGGRQRLRRAVAPRPRTSPPRSSRVHERRRRRCARRTARLVRRATPSGCRSSARCDAVLASYAREQRALVARERSAAAVRSQVNARARSRPAARRRSRRAAVAEQPLDRAARSRRRPRGRTAARRRPRPRAATSGSSTRPARRAPSPRAPAARSPRTATGTRTRRRSAYRPSRSRRRPSRGSARRPRRRAPRRARAARPRAASGSRAARAPAGARRRSRASASSSARQVLVRALGRQATARPAGRRASEPRAQLGLAASARRRRGPTPERHDVDLRRRHAAGARRGRRASLATSTITRCERRAASRHEHAHAQAAQRRSAPPGTSCRCRSWIVDDAREAAPRSGAVEREAVHEVAARARGREPRQQLLLAAHPLDAAGARAPARRPSSSRRTARRRRPPRG